MEFFLTHNPYKIETSFQIDGVLSAPAWFKSLTETEGVQMRLQLWIMRFFDELAKAYPGTKKFSITYMGTSTDCDDIIQEAKLAEDRMGIEINVKTLPCGNPDKKFEQLTQLYKEAQNGPYDGFKTLELTEAFQRITDRKLSVSVMAPMKNGKSTLLNSIIGYELLPNDTQRCTAKISYIEHDAAADTFQAKAIREKGDSDYLPCDSNLLLEWNHEDGVKQVNIRGRLAGMSASDYCLQFVDTPGPNSAIHKEDLTTVERFLGDNSLPMICYIIDIVDDDEAKYLLRLKKHMSQHGKQSEDRFIFIIPRMDILNIEEKHNQLDNPIKAKIEKIREDLKELGILNPRLFPVTSLIALKAREYTSMSEWNKNTWDMNFQKFAMGQRHITTTLNDYMALSSSVENKIKKEISELSAKIRDRQDTLAERLRYMELLSGIPALEMSIEEYLLKYSVPARISDAAQMFDEGIKKANAVQQLMTEIDSKETSLAAIQSKIANLRSFLAKGAGAKEMKQRMFPEVWTASARLQTELAEGNVEYENRIATYIAKWNVEQDENGRITPEKANAFIAQFKDFMTGLSKNMLGVYSNSVEDDARVQFKKLCAAYNESIKHILGEMPPELREFINRFTFILPQTTTITVKTGDVASTVPESYWQEYDRVITLKEDGVWEKFWAMMPGTPTTKKDYKRATRYVTKVNVTELRKALKSNSSVILQQGIESAEKIAEKHYMSMRAAMMREFEKVDKKLIALGKELEDNLADQKTKTVERDNYRKVLSWVKDFQDRLMRVLEIKEA